MFGDDVVHGENALDRATLLAQNEETLFALGTRCVHTTTHPDQTLAHVLVQFGYDDELAFAALVLRLYHLGETVARGSMIGCIVAGCIFGSMGCGILGFLFSFLGCVG